MIAEPPLIVVTGVAMLLFAAAFLVGDHIHPLRLFMRDRRSAISFGAGISIAYVFVHLLPELHLARRELVEAVAAPLPFEGAAIYFLALVGFLLFYGLDHLRERLSDPAEEEGHAGLSFKLHIGGFAAYVGLMAYLLAQDPQESAALTALYAVTIAVHFLGVDHSLREEHGLAYQRIGRFVLAGMSLLGWTLGLVATLPAIVPALLVAFIAGAIIVNSAIMELPSDKDGRFVPFVTGGLVYGTVLLLVG